MAEESVAQDQLRAFIERIERMEEEKSAIAGDIKEIYSEAKGNGFDTKVIREIVRLRKQDASDRMEHEAILDLYMGALGMVAAPPEDEPYQPPMRAAVDLSDVDADLVKAFIEGNKTEAGRKIIKRALDAANGPVTRAQTMADTVAGDGVEWVRRHSDDIKRHKYSGAFSDFGQDHYVIADDISGAKSEPVVMIGDEILDGWARYLCASRTVGLDGQTAFYPVMQYDGTDPLIDCIKWNVAGRMMSDADKSRVAQALIKIEPKRKADIIAALEMELVS